jgi:hypothetical protein
MQLKMPFLNTPKMFKSAQYIPYSCNNSVQLM